MQQLTGSTNPSKPAATEAEIALDDDTVRNTKSEEIKPTPNTGMHEIISIRRPSGDVVTQVTDRAVLEFKH